MKRDELGECIAALISEKERWISVCESGWNEYESCSESYDILQR